MAMIQMESPLTTRQNSQEGEEETIQEEMIESEQPQTNKEEKEEEKEPVVESKVEVKEDEDEVKAEEIKEDIKEDEVKAEVKENVKEEIKEPTKEIKRPRYQYSKEELLRIAELPLSKIRPAILDIAFNNNQGKWDPENWFNSKRSKEHGSFEDLRGGKRDSDVVHKRRSIDPKERLKEERDEIVLSPQRRSFGTGCHVQPTSSLARRPNSPTEMRNDYDSHSNRRLGNNRMMSRDKDRSFRNRDRFDMDDGDSRRFNNNSRFGRMNDRRYNRDEEEEPEWFSGGPTSQSDTIELVGFDNPADESKKIPRKTGKRNRETNRRLSIGSEEEEKEHPPVETKAAEVVEQVAEVNASAAEVLPSEPNPEDFDLNEILKMDWSIVENGAVADESTTSEAVPPPMSSKFSQWFKLESPLSENKNNHEDIVAGVLNGVDSDLFGGSANPRESLLASCNSWPNPGSNGTRASDKEKGGKNILDILHNANINIGPYLDGRESTYSVFDKHLLHDKAKSVEELEAGLKKMVMGPKKQQEDSTAFNRLLKHLVPDDKSPSTVSMGPIDKSKALQEKDLLFNSQGENLMAMLTETNRGSSPNSGVSVRHTNQMRPPPMPNQHMMQSEMPNMLFKLMNQSSHGGGPQLSPRPPAVSPVMYHNYQPQAAAEQASLTAMLNQQQLKQQQQQRQRELYYLQQHQMQQQQQQQQQSHRAASDMFLNIPQSGPSPRQSPGPECLMPGGQGRTPSPIIFGQQPPTISHAPAPIHPGQSSNNGASLQVQTSALPRVPSPQELAVHTQSILQHALIKRKLEEQKEKSRKQQDNHQRAKSPNNNYFNCMMPMPMQNPQVPPPKGLPSFTPPAVVRKFHSERVEKDNRYEGIKNEGTMYGSNMNMNMGNMGNMGNNGLLTTVANPEMEHNRLAPKPIHGQGLFNQRNNNPGGGRPIVKGNGCQPGGNDFYAKNCPSSGKMYKQPQYNNVEQMAKLLDQQRQQHVMLAAQRQQNVSPMAYGMTSRPQSSRSVAPPVNMHHSQQVQRNMGGIQSNNPNLRGDFSHELRRDVGYNNRPPSSIHPSNPALHQQLPSSPQLQGRPEPRQLHSRNIHPIALQQILMNSQQPSYRQRPPDAMNTGAIPMGLNRGSPVNLAKWFNNDMLKVSALPPVPHQQALLVEDVERQHSSVHN